MLISTLVMLILGIESSCDETAASIVKDGKEILSNVVATQIPFHKKYMHIWALFQKLQAENTLNSFYLW